MTLHYEDAGLRLWHGSNKDILPTFEAESFDSIVTDPPYELGFMGKGWDSSGIAYDVELWRECWRVLKPGGYLLAFGGTRTWHRIAVAIEDAGFEIRDSLAWLHSQGFPKSLNVAKAIASGTGRPEDIRRMAMGDDYEPSGRGRVNYDHGAASAMNGATADVSLPPEAQAWEGWGTALKPAFEPVIIARKPLRGTVAANVLAHGTGALNIDACRVAGAVDEMRGRSGTASVPGGKTSSYRAHNPVGGIWEPIASGRFPSNVLLDQSQAAELDKQAPDTGGSGKASGPSLREPTEAGVAFGARRGLVGEPAFYGDRGGASRFFPTFRYEAKAPSSERPEVDGMIHATVKPLDLIRWMVRLVTRPGGRVLDPFAGSGTTGEAALLEGMEVDLIELETDHLPLILQRVRKPLLPAIFGDWDGDAA